MKPNPYQSPELDTIPALPAPKVNPQVRWFAISLFAAPCFLLLTATLHRLSTELHPSDAPRVSPLVVLSLLLAFVAFLLASYTALMFAISAVWRWAVIFAAIATFNILATFSAIWIDAPSLVYAT